MGGGGKPLQGVPPSLEITQSDGLALQEEPQQQKSQWAQSGQVPHTHVQTHTLRLQSKTPVRPT